MIEEIICKYGEFSDSWISEVRYSKKRIESNAVNNFEITINCANKQNDFNYERVNLIFRDVQYFRFCEINGCDNFAIKDVLIRKVEGIVLFDFFPIDHFDYLEENPNSNFVIKCIKVEYEVLSGNSFSS